MIDNHMKIEQHIFKILLIFVAFISLIQLIEGFIIHDNFFNNIHWLISLVVTIIIFTYCYFKSCHHKTKNFYFFFLIFFIMPWALYSSSVNSPLGLAYVFILMLSINYFYKGLHRTALTASTILIATLVLLYQNLFPEQFFHYSKQELLVNIAIQVPLTLIIAAYMLSKFTDTISHKNKTLETLSNHDELTTIYNRRFIYNFMNHLQTIVSQETPSYIGLIDVDNFKYINDTYGHNIGDQVMISVAKHIKRSLNNTGLVGRYGGDEFIIIFTDSHTKPCQRILNHISNLNSIQKELNLSEAVTISGGFAIFDNTRSIDQVLSTADQRLYAAKSNGKNQIILY